MVFRVMVVLLLLLIAWGLWAVFQVGPGWMMERRIAEISSQTNSVPELSSAERSPNETAIPPPLVVSIPEPEPPALTEEQKLELLNQRVRDCMARQRGVPLPFTAGQIADTTGREYLQVAVVRLEPDGIHIHYGKGVAKLDFAQLPQYLKDRFFIEDEVAIRYREVMWEHQLVAEHKRQERTRELAKKRKENVLWNTPAASVEPTRAPAVQKLDRCEMCKGLFPAEQMKTYQALFRPKDKVRRSVNCCPSCVPYSIRNIADPYMPR